VAHDSVHYRFEQVAPGAWGAVAIDSGAGVGNAGIADLGGRALVVDCGYTPGAARDLRAAAEELAGPVERLVITHGDFDHYGGAYAFADVPILASETTRAVIEENGPGRVSGLQAEMDTYLAELEEQDAPEWELEQGRRIAAEIPGLRLTPPTETFTGERDLGAAVVIDCGTAHTASDAVVWFPEPAVLFAADLVAVGTHLNMTRGDPQNWLRALDRFETLSPAHVVPGHGPPGGAEAIAVARDYIERLLALAAEPGDHALPAEWASWTFDEGFQQNLEALRKQL
jgi:cyclase